MAEWYYAQHGRQIGPVGESDVKELAARGGLGADDLVWSEGMDEWLPVRRVPALAAAVPADDAATAARPAAAASSPFPSAPYPAPAAYPAAASPSPYSSYAAQPGYVGYAQPLAYQPSYAAGQLPGRYSGLAMTGMILGVVSFAVGGPILGIGALICGWIALSGMKRTGEQHNKGFAITALVIGIFWVVATIAIIALIVVLVAAAPNAPATSGPGFGPGPSGPGGY